MAAAHWSSINGSLPPERRMPPRFVKTCAKLVRVGGFAQLYRLTPAETRVLEQLLLKESTQEIAEALQIGIKTLRTQLSALFAKTQTKNQRELVKFYLSHPMTRPISSSP
jgi:DNA-binding CsgD family transcriptional regulator